jgi:TatD DNase family protein
MILIDSHAHLEEIKDLNSALKRAKDSGVAAVVAMGSDYDSNNKVLEIAEKYKFYVYPALGSHPWNAEGPNSELERNLHFIESNIKNIVAIGEIGLDYHKKVISRNSKDWQKETLKIILGLAAKYKKPVSVHSRYSWKDSFSLVAESKIEKAVFHWYTGPLNVLQEILGQGFLVSATLATKYHKEHRRAIKEAPLGKILLETDSPVVYREPLGRESEPADVLKTLEAVSELKGINPDTVAKITTGNALKFYEISLFGATDGNS